MEKVHSRALLLSATVHLENIPSALFVLGVFYLVKANFDKVREIGRRIDEQNVSGSSQSCEVLGYLLSQLRGFYIGEFSQALKAFSACRAAGYGQVSTKDQLMASGINPGLAAVIESVYPTWIMGYANQATNQMEEASRLAANQDSMLMRIWCQCHQGWLHFFLGEYSKAATLGRLAQKLGDDHSIAYWQVQSGMMLGWLEVTEGRIDSGLSQLERYLAMHRLIGTELISGFFLSLLADACRMAGAHERALGVIDEGIAHSNRFGERWWLAELHRLRGNILIEAAVGNTAASKRRQEGKESLRTALGLARQQEAKTLELRAATSLAKVWQGQGDKEAGCHLLQPLLAWFTEGIDCRDYREAQRVLKDLRAVCDQTPNACA